MITVSDIKEKLFQLLKTSLHYFTMFLLPKIIHSI